MLTRWNHGWSDADRLFAAMNQLHDSLSHVQPSGPFARRQGQAGPAAELRDLGDRLQLIVEVPGLSEADLSLTLNQEILTLSGARSLKAPEGASVHRQERGDLHFSRSFTLPAPIDPERARATLKDGLLTVELEKAEEALPKKIEVKAA